MKTSLWGSVLVVATLGLGAAWLAPAASAEPAPVKASKTAAAKGEGGKSNKAPGKEDSTPSQPEAAAETKPEAEAAPAPQPSAAKDEPPARKISPFGSPAPLPPAPSSAEEGEAPPAYAYPPPGFSPPWYGYPPPGYPPPGYGYPPPGYAYPPPAFGYPPPGHAMGEGRRHCHCCPHHGCEGPSRLPPEQRPGYHAHDGFFLRLGLGGGYARTAISTNSGKLTYSGTSIPINLAIGAAIGSNLILFGEVMTNQIFGPTTKYGGETQPPYSGNVSLQGVGPGVAYYFMPINITISGSLLLHKVSITSDRDDDDSTDLSTVGFAANLMAGKEWWVSRDWGVGLAANVMLGTAKNRALYDEESISDGRNGGFVDARWNSVAVGLLMSATYN